MLKIALLQLPTLSMSPSRIDYYIKVAKDSGAELVLVGEYVLNSFFTELKKMPKAMIKEQSGHKKSLFCELSKKYDMAIIAPLVLIKGDEILKVCAKFLPNSVKFYEQNFLINYDHWDETEYFNNKFENLDITTFSFKGVKFGILFGFEAHFDLCFTNLMKKNIDCLLLPTACTFDSQSRWQELLKMRAFLNSFYIARANRIGKAKFDEISHEFYGESLVVSPFGEIINSLKDEEGILLCDINKTQIKEARNLWKFRDLAKDFL